MPRINYRDIYGNLKTQRRREDASPEVEKSLPLPLGYKLRPRTVQKTTHRCVLLTVLLVPLAAWKALTSYVDADGSDYPEEDDMRVSLARHGESPHRRLKTLEYGYECMSEQDVFDRDNVKLKMVRKYHVTMGGMSKGDNNTCASKEGPCLSSGAEWTLILYLPSMLYMFVALAIVCDEFFVPSLEAFVDECDISMDVAGATFMAAGGSMPELFTSFIATFDETDVGFATIVGSAVFNVLFVIAVCAMASKETLTLTWWPLARDCIFYLLGLGLVSLFFIGITPDEIQIWEAILLFCWYVFYCSFMKFNAEAHAWVEGKLAGRASTQKVSPADTNEPPPPRLSIQGPVSMKRPSQFRTGIVQLLTQHTHITETVGIAAVTEIKGNLKETFGKLDEDNDGCITEEEFMQFLDRLGWKSKPTDEKESPAARAWKEISRDGKITIDCFTKWYTVSQARVEVEVRRVFNRFDRDGDGTIDSEEIKALLLDLGHKVGDEDVSKIMTEMLDLEESIEESTGATDSKQERELVKIEFDMFENWYKNSMFSKRHQEQNEMQAKEGESPGFSIDWPEDPSPMQLFWYIFTYPLCAAMYCSLPDVRRPGADGERLEGKSHLRWAVIEFLLSLVWIAVFSNALYECVIVCSNTIGIPPPVAGVTVLAGGTSIPDLLSSYIVARQGEGDMAVSSSIGSNLFDITVGLPIPWVSYMIYKSIDTGTLAHVKVESKSLPVSILVLIFMLASVLCTVMAMKWRMTRALGCVMLCLYLLFIFIDLMQNLPVGDPIWDFTLK